MKSRDFCFWLQGYFEINNLDTPLTVMQQEVIKKHLAMVFIHEIDPSMPNPKLDQVHAQPNATAIMRC